jgi:hypothetical protein
MAFEWVAGLFQSEQTRGLSGDSASTVALDDANPYYNYRLRRHLAEGDIVQEPGLLWYTSPYVKQRTGLGTHVGAEVGEGVANYTDVLLILSHEDFARSRKIAGEPWDEVTARTLSQEFDNFCRRENFNRVHVHRQLRFKVLCDGGDDMAGQSLGLQRGEFITGLLPNMYTGPVRGSHAVIGIHVNLPGVWDGYQEVGCLHNDQILFTLGSHWLDNFSHPNLREAALYRLQQYPDGSFVHIINPDLQDRYQVTSTDQSGASVLTLATRDGNPLAYVVLAVMEPPASMPPIMDRDDAAEARPGIALPSMKADAQGDDEDAIPSVAPPMLIDDQLQPVLQAPSSGLGGKTIIPDAPSERIFTLQERGALLQKVHFSAFMLGYDVYLGSRGELGTVVESAAATFQVRKKKVFLVAHVEGVTVEGEMLEPGVQFPLDKNVTLQFGNQLLDYRDLRGLRIEGWPYVGEIRRPASSTYMIWGEQYQIGRSRECRVVLPDEPRNDNIHWKAKVGDGSTIRARTGEIPKSRFYTDSIMVASEHATIDLGRDDPQVVCTARHCHIYVRRTSEITPLFPSTSGREPQNLDISPGDEILIGNCLFQVGFTQGEAVAPAPAPKIEFSADSLVDAVQAPNFDESSKATPDSDSQREDVEKPDAKQRRADRHRAQSLASEAPPAGGLGELGVEPAPVPLGDVEMDSILGDASTLERLEKDEQASSDAPPTSEETEPPSAQDAEDAEDAQDAQDAQDAEDAQDAQDAQDAEDAPAQPAHASLEKNPVIEETDDVGDDPTIPGLVLPRETLDAIGIVDEEPPEPQVQTKSPQPVGAGQLADDAGWDEEDWESDTSSLMGKSPDHGKPSDEDSDDAPMSTSEVPPPFPDVEDSSLPKAEDAEPVREAPPKEPDADDEGKTVVYVDDTEAQFELGRPMHLIMTGWMVNGEVTCANHTDAELVLPESRMVDNQMFKAVDYFKLKLRGRKGRLEILAPSELLIDEDDPSETIYEKPEAHIIDVIRRDDAGEEDFAIRLEIDTSQKLPDPRARLVCIDYEDPLAAALITRGLPRGKPRTLSLGTLTATFTFDGSGVTITDYLETYQRGDEGYHPFFIQRGDSRFTTAPEDGADIALNGGDRIVIGIAVYTLAEE